MLSRDNIFRRFPTTGMVLISLVIMLTATVPALADAPLSDESDERMERALARSVLEIRTPTSRGTGVYAVIDQQHVIITAAHVIRGSNMMPAFGFMFRSYNAHPSDLSEWININDVALDALVINEIDLAVILLDGPLSGFVPAEVSTDPAEIGQDVLAYGFGRPHGARLRGEVSGFDVKGEWFMSLQMPVIPGDSGGPIFDAASGRLIGIVIAQASPEMSELFECTALPDQMMCAWPNHGQPRSARALATNLTNIMRR